VQATPMKSTVRVIVAFVVIGFGVSAIRAVSGQTMWTVADLKNRFTINVPTTWQVQTSTAAFAPNVSATAPTQAGQLPDSVDVTVRTSRRPLPVTLLNSEGVGSPAPAARLRARPKA